MACRRSSQGSHRASQHAYRVCCKGCSACTSHQLPAHAGAHRGRAVQVPYAGPAERPEQPASPEGLRIYPLPSGFTRRYACSTLHLAPREKPHDDPA